jgi:predicted acylesterase/phospholipase RssA
MVQQRGGCHMNTDKPGKVSKTTGGEKEAPIEAPAPSATNRPNAAGTGTPSAPTPASPPMAPTPGGSPMAPTATYTDAIDKMSAAVKAMSVAIEALKAPGTRPAIATTKPTKAICLGGGGPAAGLHIGALEGLKKNGIEFNNADSVWALSCIGAWVGAVYNQATAGREIEETYDFFRKVFRDDDSFKSFPVNTIFAPDWAGNAEAIQNFLFDLKNYKNAFLPRKIMESFLYTLSVLGDRKSWRKFNEGDFNRWTLNHVLAVHPVVRFLTAMAFKSEIDGLTKLYYPDSSLIKDIKFDKLFESDKPYIFHNAFNFQRKDIDLFANKWPASVTDRKQISAASLCACSALPFVEQTVKLDGKVYCEGALVDTVNFKDLLRDHRDSLKEIWINRIVDTRQIREPKNLYDGLANLCQLFAATVGEDDVKLFKYRVRENNRSRDPDALKWKGTIIEIQVDDQIDFHWSEKNLNTGRTNGARKAAEAVKLYNMYKSKPPTDGVLIIPDDLTIPEIEAAGVPVPLDRKRDGK